MPSVQRSRTGARRTESDYATFHHSIQNAYAEGCILSTAAFRESRKLCSDSLRLLFYQFFQFLVNFSVVCVVYWNKVHILLKAQLTVVCYGTVILCSD